MKPFMAFLAALFLLLPTMAIADSSDTMNIRIDPVPLSLEVSLDFKIAENWTLGPQLIYRYLGYHTSADPNVTRTAYGVGARTNWFKNGAFTNGLYVGAALEYSKLQAKNSSSPGISVIDSKDGLLLSGLVGYGWFWNSFNMILGGGVITSLVTPDIEYSDSTGTHFKYSYRNSPKPLLEFTIGWSF